ncbi:MAG: HEAT repeat domain-containing protein, partial [Planctomycetota bacterium]
MTAKCFMRCGGIVAMLVATASMSGCWQGTGDPVMSVDPTRAMIRSRAELMASLTNEDPVTRANALEAVSSTLGSEAGAHFIEALDDPEPMVRFAAAMVIGDNQYAPAKERLLQLMANPQTDPVMQCALIYALHQLGVTRFNERLGTYLHDPDKTLRGNVVLVMGKIGHRSAIDRIKGVWADEKDLGVEVGIVESLATLGDAVAAQQLEGFCRMQRMVSVQLPAIRAVARLAPPDVNQILLDRLQKDPSPRVKVAAAGGLARVGVDDDDGYILCINALR